ncbi:MAG: hydrogenase maturation nickel metallochaperone HypA [Thermodesulfobacteriota bacterium]
MHELSLVQGLLRQLAELASKHGASAISRVTVEIGPLSGVVVDSFSFGFEVLAVQEELTRRAKLEIVVPPLRWRCCHCGAECMADGAMPESCPHCRRVLLVPCGGDGIILLQVEME